MSKKVPSLTYTILLILFLPSWLAVPQVCFSQSVRNVTELKSGWLFLQGDVTNGADNLLNENGWKKVTVPHDWAISGPFREENDRQMVQVTEDGDQKVLVRSGRTGGLPYTGVGWYRYHLKLNAENKQRNLYLEFDGAMSHAKVYINNRIAGQWPYGYASFIINISSFVRFGSDNVIAVRLENYPESSRWYPGAGLYRNVRLVETGPTRIAPRGTFVTTPVVTKGKALVRVETKIETAREQAENVQLETRIYDQYHRPVGHNIITFKVKARNVQDISIDKPVLWSADHPVTYYVVSVLRRGNKIVDRLKTTFGVRTVEFSPAKGMLVNGTVVKLKGVCLHDDLGPLGMAVNTSVLRYRLKLLKEMGCNAIRGTHNPHAPELLDLCDEMGFYYIDEAFDEWKLEKVRNGYHLLFDDWAKKDLEAMIQRDRNHPALIMYSIGNEVKEQGDSEGARVASYLASICHLNDSSRPVTSGFNNMNAAIKNGLAKSVDIPGWNYKPDYYSQLHRQFPGWVIYGSETVSTVSSRGVFKLPADTAVMKIWEDNQSSAYDLEYCRWSQLPDVEWRNQENGFVAGEFVWTGFDYLGEPTPYTNNWPSRSSYFGIIDLCGLPKDRYYLYQSKWSNKKVLHLLPHWNWQGGEGKTVPVHVYTNYSSAEVFINGKSYGRKTFDKSSLLDRYRLRWENTIYAPGELKVIAYDAAGRPADTKIIKTAGQPRQIFLKPDRMTLSANGEDISMVEVIVADKDGNLCPLSDELIHFEVTGAGKFRAGGNGDPTSLSSFQVPQMKAFYGKCMVLIQSDRTGGIINLIARGENLKPCELQLKSVKQ